MASAANKIESPKTGGKSENPSSLEVTILHLKTSADGVTVDIKDTFIYHAEKKTGQDGKASAPKPVESRYLARRAGQADALQKALALYEDRRKDYVAIVACLEVRDNKNAEEAMKLRETRRFLRKLQRRIVEANRLLRAAAGPTSSFSGTTVSQANTTISSTSNLTIPKSVSKRRSTTGGRRAPRPSDNTHQLKVACPNRPKSSGPKSTEPQSTCVDARKSSSASSTTSGSVNCADEEINQLLRECVDLSKQMAANPRQLCMPPPLVSPDPHSGATSVRTKNTRDEMKPVGSQRLEDSIETLKKRKANQQSNDLLTSFQTPQQPPHKTLPTSVRFDPVTKSVSTTHDTSSEGIINHNNNNINNNNIGENARVKSAGPKSPPCANARPSQK